MLYPPGVGGVSFERASRFRALVKIPTIDPIKFTVPIKTQRPDLSSFSSDQENCSFSVRLWGSYRGGHKSKISSGWVLKGSHEGNMRKSWGLYCESLVDGGDPDWS